MSSLILLSGAVLEFRGNWFGSGMSQKVKHKESPSLPTPNGRGPDTSYFVIIICLVFTDGPKCLLLCRWVPKLMASSTFPKPRQHYCPQSRNTQKPAESPAWWKTLSLPLETTFCSFSVLNSVTSTALWQGTKGDLTNPLCPFSPFTCFLSAQSFAA